MARNNNLNINIFTMLKVSEISKVPVLLLSCPGAGKSSTVELFSKVRGYKTVLLRGNSTTAEEILGYDTCPKDVTRDEPSAAIHLRPSWFDSVLRNHKSGQKTLLFLDEITTANEYVQSALLHLIFERKCGEESLPEDTLIVSAGNYAQNLSNTMNLLPPVMNRFMIFNIVPSRSDLDIFLNKFEGCLTNGGKRKDYMKELEKKMKALDSQEKDIPSEQYNKIGEYVERGLKDVTSMMWQNGTIDPSITELQGIYSDTDSTDPKVYGFISLRTLNYAREITMAFYKCFGKAGIQSDNYRAALEGLIGIGLKRDSKKSGEVVTVKVAKDYFDHMQPIVNEIEKMNNDRMPVYEEYFNDLLKNKDKIGVPELQAATNKIAELRRDEALKTIERPIAPEVILELIKKSKEITGSLIKKKTDSLEETLKSAPLPEYVEAAQTWNIIAEMVQSLGELLVDTEKGYTDATVQDARLVIREMRQDSFRLKTFRKAIIGNGVAANLAPNINDFKFANG